MGVETPGGYAAIMSHSGSRGAGSNLAGHYTKLATDDHPELPKQLRHLAWLDLDSDLGRECWLPMTLMGEYAEACHRVNHDQMVRGLRCKALGNVYNRHNFAWKEQHDGEQLIVHRKGATPPSDGQLGVIPESMAHPAYVVRGLGSEQSLRSASHGAGRRLSRKRAEVEVDRGQVKAMLRERGVTVLSAGHDENPFAYKDNDEVMSQQTDLVEPIAQFIPKIVKMAPPAERWKETETKAVFSFG